MAKMWQSNGRVNILNYTDTYTQNYTEKCTDNFTGNYTETAQKIR